MIGNISLTLKVEYDPESEKQAKEYLDKMFSIDYSKLSKKKLAQKHDEIMKEFIRLSCINMKIVREEPIELEGNDEQDI